MMKNGNSTSYDNWRKRLLKLEGFKTSPDDNQKYSPLTVVMVYNHLTPNTKMYNIYGFVDYLLERYLFLVRYFSVPIYKTLLEDNDYEPFPIHKLICIFLYEERDTQQTFSYKLHNHVAIRLLQYGDEILNEMDKDNGWWYPHWGMFPFLPPICERNTECPRPFNTELLMTVPYSGKINALCNEYSRAMELFQFMKVPIFGKRDDNKLIQGAKAMESCMRHARDIDLLLVARADRDKKKEIFQIFWRTVHYVLVHAGFYAASARAFMGQTFLSCITFERIAKTFIARYNDASHRATRVRFWHTVLQATEAKFLYSKLAHLALLKLKALETLDHLCIHKTASFELAVFSPIVVENYQKYKTQLMEELNGDNDDE